jgi:glycosyltransferase involved in cell wall biosynthesis
MTKLSIVTINYNNIGGLKRTVESVINQSWKEFEYIVIDGGSTDGSAEYISEMKSHFAYWVCEPDKGVYNAMNKGLNVASGEYIFILNSGDCLIDIRVLENVSTEIGIVNMQTGKQNVFLGSTRQEGSDHNFSPPEEVTLYHLYRSAIPHQGQFLPRNLTISYPFREDYKIVSDWIQSVEILLSGIASYINIKSQKTIAINEKFGLCASIEMQTEKERYMATRGDVFRRIEDYDMLRKKYDKLNYIRTKGIANRILWKLMTLFVKENH